MHLSILSSSEPVSQADSWQQNGTSRGSFPPEPIKLSSSYWRCIALFEASVRQDKIGTSAARQ